MGRRPRAGEARDHLGRGPEGAISDDRIFRARVDVGDRREAHRDAERAELARLRLGEPRREIHVAEIADAAHRGQGKGRRGNAHDASALLIDRDEWRQIGRRGFADGARELGDLSERRDVSPKKRHAASGAGGKQLSLTVSELGARETDDEELATEDGRRRGHRAMDYQIARINSRPIARREGSGGSACLRPMRSRMRFVFQLLVFAVVTLSVRASFADHYRVPSGSMTPTVHVDDHVLVAKAAYGVRVPMTTRYVVRFSAPARGDVVVLESPDPSDPIVLLKRVVAIGGDQVEVKDGMVLIDGVLVDTRGGGGPDFGPARVPDDSLLVLGDNRGNSRDGRTFGFVSRDRVLGRAIAVVARDGLLAYEPL